MNKTLEASRILMTRQSCENFPVVPVPEGFTLCWYAPGFEKHWLAIHLAAEKEIPITPELFAKKFGSDPETLAARQCFLFSSEGVPAGTLTAWYDPNFEGANYGRLHFLAVDPRFQRRGLAKVLMSSALQRLKDLGHQRAYLATSSMRASAIRIYLHFGFIPLIKTAADQAQWQQILRGIELGSR